MARARRELRGDLGADERDARSPIESSDLELAHQRPNQEDPSPAVAEDVDGIGGVGNLIQFETLPLILDDTEHTVVSTCDRVADKQGGIACVAMDDRIVHRLGQGNDEIEELCVVKRTAVADVFQQFGDCAKLISIAGELALEEDLIHMIKVTKVLCLVSRSIVPPGGEIQPGEASGKPAVVKTMLPPPR